MNKILFYMFILIMTLVLVAYYKGSSSILQTFGGFVDKTILFLQGRNEAGEFANYPQEY